MSDVTSRITVDSIVCNGKLAFRGKENNCQAILEYLSAGDSYDDILAQYPTLEINDLLAALKCISR